MESARVEAHLEALVGQSLGKSVKLSVIGWKVDISGQDWQAGRSVNRAMAEGWCPMGNHLYILDGLGCLITTFKIFRWTSAKPGFQGLRTLNLVAMGRYVALHSMP